MELKNGSTYEFVTKLGVTFIGTATTTKGNADSLNFVDVLVVTMRPVKTPQGEMSMVPAMDMVGIFTIDSVFSVPSSDLYQIAEVEYNAFVDMYKANVNMYTDAKRAHGSDIQITSKMPDIAIQK